MKIRFLALASLLILNLHALNAYAAGGALDGKTFVGTVLDEGDKEPGKDTFIFANGTFHSTMCDQYGYGPGGYESASKNGAVHFTATTKNTSGDTIVWTGTSDGTSIKGSSVRTTAKGNKYNSSFEGKLKGSVKG